MASHNTHDKCLIYFALKPHLSCLIACATTLKIYLPHHTPHIQQCMKKTGKKETDSERKRKGNKKQLTHTHKHTTKCCQAFVCCAVCDTPLIYVPSTASGRWLRLFLWFLTELLSLLLYLLMLLLLLLLACQCPAPASSCVAFINCNASTKIVCHFYFCVLYYFRLSAIEAFPDFFLCSSFCFCFPLTADHCKKGNACGYALNCCQFLSSYLSFSLFFLGCTSFFLLLPTHIIELGPVVREKENVNYLNLRKTEPEKGLIFCTLIYKMTFIKYKLLFIFKILPPTFQILSF